MNMPDGHHFEKFAMKLRRNGQGCMKMNNVDLKNKFFKINKFLVNQLE
jgi:hypothetical protein